MNVPNAALSDATIVPMSTASDRKSIRVKIPNATNAATLNVCRSFVSCAGCVRLHMELQPHQAQNSNA